MSYKYAIKERLWKLPMSEYKKVRKQLPKLLGKTVRTFDRYCNIKTDEFADIPVQDLDIIASYLNCKADDLKNFSVAEFSIRYNINRY
ncbi:MAG: hypothetical protein H6586_04985 [Flavobacteriales bacterium]|nr:hypothetical protein [Flavobacteriales bacterium]